MAIVDEDLLEHFRLKPFCEYCGRARTSTHRLDPHHLRCRGMDGGSRLDVPPNLVALCRPCHTLAQENREVNELLFLVVAFREYTSVDALRQYLGELQNEQIKKKESTQNAHGR